MTIELETSGIAVRDLEATIAFFTDLGLTVLGRDTVSGEWADTAAGLDGTLGRRHRRGAGDRRWHGCPLCGVATYADVDELTYLRGPSGSS